jgi:hypothetical protein
MIGERRGDLAGNHGARAATIENEASGDFRTEDPASSISFSVSPEAREANCRAQRAS